MSTATNSHCQHPGPLLSLEQVWLRYRSAGPWVLKNCSMDIFHGERVLISGCNGSGKSTLLKIIAGVMQPQQGQCQRCGHRPCACAYLAQEHSIDWDLPVTVQDFIWSGRTQALRWGRLATTADYARVAEALHTVALEDFRQRPINALSGGQRQRLLIGRTLAQGANILLLDEPLSGLDTAARGQLADILQHIHQQLQLTVVMTSHETEGFPMRWDRHLMMDGGCLAVHACSAGTVAAVAG